ncbi:tetratricopeptide repeat protein [bacterium]|nr:tetratricopeptide repeat protein [bacterium]
MVKYLSIFWICLFSVLAFTQEQGSIPELERPDSMDIHPAIMETMITDAPEIPETRENLLRFADYLFAEKEYSRAAVEYHRFRFKYPEDENQHYALLRIGLSYEKCQAYERARNYYKQLINNPNSDKYSSAAYYRMASTYYEEGDWEGTLAYIGALQEVNDRLGGAFSYLKGWCLLHTREYRAAQKIFEELNNNNVEGQQVSSLYYLISKSRQAQIMSKRSPLVSGLFSSILPGSGQLYCKRFGDAGFSFAFTVGFGTAAIALWEEDRSFAITSALLASFFYLGNIYGAINSAIIYNNHAHSEFIQKTEEGVPHKAIELYQNP